MTWPCHHQALTPYSPFSVPAGHVGLLSKSSSNTSSSFLWQDLCMCSSLCQECFPCLLSHWITSYLRGLSYHPTLDNVICSHTTLHISHIKRITIN